MKVKAIRTDGAPLPAARYSQAVLAGDTLYVQGVLPLDPVTGKLVDGGIGFQAERVLCSLEAILREAGMGLDRVVKVTVFMADMTDFPEFNRVYATRFTADPPPARTTVQAGIPMGALLEVEAIAVR